MLSVIMSEAPILAAGTCFTQRLRVLLTSQTGPNGLS
jgi:hypothetical protein